MIACFSLSKMSSLNKLFSLSELRLVYLFAFHLKNKDIIGTLVVAQR